MHGACKRQYKWYKAQPVDRDQKESNSEKPKKLLTAQDKGWARFDKEIKTTKKKRSSQTKRYPIFKYWKSFLN